MRTNNDSPNSTVSPLDVAVAKTLGLEELSPGIHWQRESRHGPKTGRLRVECVWLLRIELSFEPPGLILGVRGVEEANDGHFLRDVSKIAVAANGEVVAGDYDTVPLESAIELLPVFGCGFSLVLDGVGYTLEVKSEAARTHIEFFNPGNEAYLLLEREALAAARAVVTQLPDEALAVFVSNWEKYRSPRA